MAVHAKAFDLIYYLWLIYIFFALRWSSIGRSCTVGGGVFWSVPFVDGEMLGFLAYVVEEIVERGSVWLRFFLGIRCHLVV